MESSHRGGSWGRGGRPPRRDDFGRGMGTRGSTYGGRSRGPPYNWPRRGIRGSRNPWVPFRQAQRGSRGGTSFAEDRNAAGLSAEHPVDDRSSLTSQEDVGWERDIGRRTDVHQSDTESLSAPFAFPSFDEVTTGSKNSSTDCSNIFELTECSLIDHVHQCFQKAVKGKVSAKVGDLTIVPQRSLGRTISVTTCNPPWRGAVGGTIALLDMERRDIFYGEIVQVESDQVVVFHNCEDVLNVQPNYAFTMVDTSLSTSVCVELSSLLVSRKESSLLRQLWLGAGERLHSAGPSSVAERQCPKVPAVLDQSQAEAFCAAVSEPIALIHAPSGSGTKVLLKAMVDYLCSTDLSLSKQPLLLISQNPLQFQAELNWTPDQVFNIDDKQMREVTSVAQESFQAVLSFGEVKSTLSRVHDLLLQMYEADTSILHQSFFDGITRAYSLKRNVERNLLEGWLLDNVDYKEMSSSVSEADVQRFQEHCKRRPVRKLDVAESSNKDVCFAFDRSSQAESALRQETFIPSDENFLKATYVWKNLSDTRPNPDLMSVVDLRELEASDCWRLYKHWVVLFLEMKKKELRKTLQHLAISAEQYKQIWMDVRACLKLTQPVIMASAVTAVAHRSLLDILKPRVTIVCDATEIKDLYVPALLPQSTEKVVFVGDSLNPRPVASSCWSRLLRSGNFEVHELVFRYLQSQELCELLSPVLQCKPISRKTPQRLNGVRETVQFFNLPDSEEAAFMISRLCVHLEAHNYKSSDVAVMVLPPQLSTVKTLMLILRQQGCSYSVCTLKSFYPRRCKIAVVYLCSSSAKTDLASALSRVGFAVYVFGDFSKTDESCQNIINTAKASNEDLFRGSLSLTCVCHPGEVISVASRQDFQRKLRCHGFCNVLVCGHAREFVDTEVCRVVAPSQQPCEKTICKRNHRCPNKCSDRCSQLCTRLATAKLPVCGHDASLPCHQLDAALRAQECLLADDASGSTSSPSHVPYNCTVEVTKTRPCGHVVRVRCGESVHSPCQEYSEKTLPTCGHVARLACHMWGDPANLVGHKCTETVTVTAPCGHRAIVQCHKLDYRLEGQARLLAGHRCRHEVKKKALCGHLVDVKCCEAPSTQCQECRKARQQLYKPQGFQAGDSSGGDVSCSQKVQGPDQDAATNTFPCGHPVPARRSGLVESGELRCQVLVPITRQCGHVFRSACSDSRRASDFPPCLEVIREVRPCGHEVMRPCSKSSPPQCEVSVSRTLTSGHVARGPCWLINCESIACDATVGKPSACGTSRNRTSVFRSDGNPSSPMCNVRLACGHMCCQRSAGHAKHACDTCKDKCCIS